MNLDKTIKELTDRLDIVHPYSASKSISNHENRNDGINYWKGKRIISTKAWNELYEKSSTYTNAYTTTLISRRPLQYFLDDYNGSISTAGVVDEKLKEEIQNWNSDYYELLEYRKNPTLGRMKCSKCLLSGSNDDPIFVGIEKVFARIVSNQCNNKNNEIHNTRSDGLITYHCNIMNIFLCPFESKENSSINIENNKVESIYPYKRGDLFFLQRIAFAIEQAITTFFEITKNNEIIYEVDFVNDRVHEIHTNYYGEPESWGWNENVREQLSKVKPISNIVIRDEQDIYYILTNREKLEYLFQEYEKNQLDKEDKEEEGQVCCEEKPLCVNSNKEKLLTNNILSVGSNHFHMKHQDNIDNDSHKGENGHSKNTEDEGLDIEYLKPDIKSKIIEELEKSDKEQLILLKENKQTILDFLLDNKDSIKIEDLKIYEPVYRCYREKGKCHICNSLSNIVCNNCSSHNKENWLCTNHWQKHAIEKHPLLI